MSHPVGSPPARWLTATELEWCVDQIARWWDGLRPLRGTGWPHFLSPCIVASQAAEFVELLRMRMLQSPSRPELTMENKMQLAKQHMEDCEMNWSETIEPLLSPLLDEAPALIVQTYIQLYMPLTPMQQCMTAAAELYQQCHYEPLDSVTRWVNPLDQLLRLSLRFWPLDRLAALWALVLSQPTNVAHSYSLPLQYTDPVLDAYVIGSQLVARLLDVSGLDYAHRSRTMLDVAAHMVHAQHCSSAQVSAMLWGMLAAADQYNGQSAAGYNIQPTWDLLESLAAADGHPYIRRFGKGGSGSEALAILLQALPRLLFELVRLRPLASNRLMQRTPGEALEWLTHTQLAGPALADARTAVLHVVPQLQPVLSAFAKLLPDQTPDTVIVDIALFAHPRWHTLPIASQQLAAALAWAPVKQQERASTTFRSSQTTVLPVAPTHK